LHPLDGACFTEFYALFARRLLPLLAMTTEQDADPVESNSLGVNRDGDSPELGDDVAFSGTQDALADILRTEMDRCDRYHTMVGLVAFRITGQDTETIPVSALVAEISRRLRSSDHTACLEDGTIMVIVPEDIQSLPRLQKRVTAVLRSLTGNEDLAVLSASRVYPGGGDSPAHLINSTLGALPG